MNIIYYECVVALSKVTSVKCVYAYCHLWIPRLYNIFPHLINRTIFRKKKLLNTKCVF
jgi:hypothetical protein